MTMNFEKATKSLNKIHDLEWAEQSERDKEHKKYLNDLRKSYNKIISDVENYYNTIVNNGLERKPEYVSVDDHDVCLTFHNYTNVEDIEDKNDSYGRIIDRVEYTRDKNLSELAKLLKALYNEYRLDYKEALTILSEVLKLHGMRIRANIHIQQRRPVYYAFSNIHVENKFVCTEFDVDFMKEGSYVPLVITKDLPSFYDFHNFIKSNYWKPIDSKQAKNGAILRYSVKEMEDSYLPDPKTIKYHFTRYF